MREIRALKGFYRYDMLRITAPDIGAGLNWLPAVEVYGEGIFFALREERLVAWEMRPEVVSRCVVLHNRLQKSIWSRFLPAVSAAGTTLYRWTVRALIERWMAETTPTVSVFSLPSGLPIAATG